ncbi:glycosyltransferase [Pediococcus acidilactici]|uniref:glycosyltransferase family 4 protein n=2 Tax=Pediococcus acidilactici TaxID=1254 RepID=UPI001327296E|nr:glycosyltransferase family 4 protein [Pediococcus acidilactici]KAF0343767.1 glycosyltransferase [Pediococcus acidilactici]KAF0353586.1 glycosyltransferase [Pediococcus acidilactici]KAF0357923.1 glycosyltransferase [Pediococcus acidilactici]KAF0362085.1 glycosyltransferase [Pediococcus acidilactici]KAF0385552.1 glycosyltransferase [Pediococcus acidilactici]
MKVKMKVNYIAYWDNDREATWSGTTHSLLSALKENNHTNNVNMNNGFNDLLSRINFKAFQYLNIDFFNVYLKKRLKKLALRQLSNSVINIQIHSIVNLPNSYIYEDLIWEALSWIKRNDPNSFKVSGFQTVRPKIFNLRLNQQRQLIGNDKTILAMSQWLTDFINKNTAHKAVYVGGGINTPLGETPIEKRDDQTFLFVGRDFYRKGGDLVVSAFNKLKLEYPKAKLIVAGPDKNTIPEEMRSASGVHFIGDVSVDKIGQLMSTATCFVMPSRFEAYGLVFVEAMANGMPIIARDKYEMPYFASKGSGLIMRTEKNKNSEIDNLLKCMTELLENRNHYLGKAQETAPKIAQEYSWAAVADRITNAIENDRA